jgi:hypothetical protein
MNQQIKGVIRHGLTFGAGVLVAGGWIDEGAANELIGSLGCVIVTVWSVVSKKQDKPE